MDTTSFDIDKLLIKGKIGSEYELEHALLADRKLRLIIKKNPDLKEKRLALREIIKTYEFENWSLDSNITKTQIKLSDEAEILVDKELEFIQKRKHLIKSKLKVLNLNQQEFGQILGHNSKSYVSELINGVCPFSLKDIIIISRLLKIELDDLVFMDISYDDRKHIQKTIKKLAKPTLNLDSKEFAFT